MDIYREAILDHYKNPRNFGHLENPDAVQEEHNRSCGDRVVIEVKFKTQNSKLKTRKAISQIAFSGEGCAISQASASMLTEDVIGKNVKDVSAMTTEDILEMLGATLTPARIKCAALPLEVLQRALAEI